MIIKCVVCGHMTDIPPYGGGYDKTVVEGLCAKCAGLKERVSK